MSSCNGTGFSDATDQAIYTQASWWLEYVAEIIIGILGIFGNTLGKQ